MLHRSPDNLDEKLRVVLAASEAVPWSKTGGLADVSTALAKSLAAAGHEVSLVIPYHRQTPFARETQTQIHDTGVTVEIPVGAKTVTGRLHWADLPRCGARIILVDQPDYFDRPGLYQDSHGDYADNCERFVFFSRAVIAAIRALVLRPHIIQASDWQTGLVPALLQIEERDAPGFENARAIFTIHNLAYQGWFDRGSMSLTGLDWKFFNWQQMECYDQLNLLKTGIVFADQVTTVSPTYAQEIQTPEWGCGFHDLLRHRARDLTGILNGIDTDTWNPENDPYLVSRYNIDCFTKYKPDCKAYLQKRVGLPERPDVPLFGMISRMTDQKGFDLITQSAREILEEDVQLVFLGSGQERYESMFRELASKHPEQVATIIGFDEALAHQIEAGADFYLMPSRFEPCGLNQMYSLAYGTVPLVRRAGGLADSVVDLNTETQAGDTATGIVFDDYDGASFLAAFRRCLLLYREPDTHRQLIRAGMRRDSSWQSRLDEYIGVYRKALAGSPQPVG